MLEARPSDLRHTTGPRFHQTRGWRYEETSSRRRCGGPAHCGGNISRRGEAHAPLCCISRHFASLCCIPHHLAPPALRPVSGDQTLALRAPDASAPPLCRPHRATRRFCPAWAMPRRGLDGWPVRLLGGVHPSWTARPCLEGREFVACERLAQISTRPGRARHRSGMAWTPCRPRGRRPSPRWHSDRPR